MAITELTCPCGCNCTVKLVDGKPKWSRPVKKKKKVEDITPTTPPAKKGLFD